MLHITNGDVVVERMRDGGLPGEYLPWRDVLHEGPVPLTPSLDALSAIRARYLAECGYGDESALAADFRNRDAMLAGDSRRDEIVLWFEHDLYDQLQLLQVLDSLAARSSRAMISLIVVGAYPGIVRFVGLGQLSPEQVVGLLDTRVPATAEHFDVASRAWSAFRQPTPMALAELLTSDSPLLQYLGDAVQRLLEELPSAENGLSRTERTALGAIAQGVGHPRAIFAELQAAEQHPFMGDWSFWKVLDTLTRGEEPLLTTAEGSAFSYPPRAPDGYVFDAQRLKITPAGREVLENRRDAVRLLTIDRWLGGTHLLPDTVWRWDGENQRLLAPR
jgi:hypothetical protein